MLSQSEPFQTDVLAEWLDKLDQLNPSRIELGLDRVKAVADRLNWPDKLPKTTTIAGTNGKGTCAYSLEALCLSEGVETGTFISPHLISFNERFRLNGKAASDHQISSALNRIELARKETHLTYFEYAALAAIDLFVDAGVNQMILEVGLGGRLDAVNIVDADVAVITSVDLDHTEWLGETREQIGFEKAGIIKPGSIAIIADQNAPKTVLDHANLVGAEIVQLDADANGGLNPSSAAAITAFEQIGHNLNEPRAGQVLSDLQIPGRFQVVDHAGKKIIFDVAHNVAAANWLVNELEQNGLTSVDIVLGIMQDKRCEEFVAALSPLAKQWWLADIPEIPRACDSKTLAGYVDSCWAQAPISQSQIFPSPEFALEEALEKRGGECVLVCGSFYTVGRCLDFLGVEIG